MITAATPTPSTATLAIYRAQSTVVGASGQNSCLVDNAVGQTQSVDWGVYQGPSTTTAPFLSPSGINLFESAGVFDPQHWPDYMSNPRTPVYYGSRTGDQFTAVAEQDGMPICFVWHGDLTGSFSPDGLTFDAVENIKYTHFGEDDMVVRRHWTGTRR